MRPHPHTDDERREEDNLYRQKGRYERDHSMGERNAPAGRPPPASDEHPVTPEPPAGASSAPPQAARKSGEGPPPGEESRDEVVERVVREQEDIYWATGSTPERDVTSRRRLGRRAVATGLTLAVVGAAAGLAIGIVAWSAWLPISLAVAGFVIGILVTAERDDGAIAERARSRLESTGRIPRRPA